jgi:hypothetical protein
MKGRWIDWREFDDYEVQTLHGFRNFKLGYFRLGQFEESEKIEIIKFLKHALDF